MTGNLSGWGRGVRNTVAGAAVVVAMVGGSVGIVHADPSTDPSPAPAPAPTAAVAAPTTTPPATRPTVALEGGAAVAPTATPAGAAAGDVLDQLAQDYAVGAGGGQLSNLLKTALKLRAMGFKPSKQYLDELTKAMTYRPNQLPLIGALKDTIAYQQKLQAQMDVLTKAQAAQNGNGANSAVMGAAPMPGPSNPANLMPQPGAQPGPQAAAAAPAAPVIVAPTP